MKRKFEMIWDGNNPIATFYGHISLDDILEANDLVIGDPRFDQMKYQIFDFSKIEHMEMRDDIADIIAKMDSSSSTWNDNVKVATITPDSYVKSRIEEYNTLMESSPWIARTFDTYDEGLHWCKGGG